MTSSRPIDLTLDNADARSTPRSAPESEVGLPSKRVGLQQDGPSSIYEVQESNQDEEDGENDEDNCSICLHRVEDRTVIPNCSHEFCFECLLVWIGTSRDGSLEMVQLG